MCSSDLLVLQQVVKAQRVAAARLEVRGIHDAPVAHALHGIQRLIQRVKQAGRGGLGSGRFHARQRLAADQHAPY